MLGIFIDLSKAFDTVNHKILITKIKNYGIRNKNLKRFISYLSNKKQYISYNEQQINMANTISGVPQGSILGQLLFFLFMLMILSKHPKC